MLILLVEAIVLQRNTPFVSWSLIHSLRLNLMVFVDIIKIANILCSNRHICSISNNLVDNRTKVAM